MIERLISEFDWLHNIIKSSSKSYKQFIIGATPEQVTTILNSLTICSKCKLVSTDKNLKNVARLQNLTRQTLNIMLIISETTVKAAIQCVLLKLVVETINHVIECEGVLHG